MQLILDELRALPVLTLHLQTGLTFGQWRQQARLLRALELLATGEKVIDVALALAYDSPSAFASIFRKQFDQTPSQCFAGSWGALQARTSNPLNWPRSSTSAPRCRSS